MNMVGRNSDHIFFAK